jgi:hypothetical protein
MGRKLAPRETELYKRCDEVLHYIWDPIGVAGAPGARDEYESYLPQVFARVRDEADPEEIVKYLVSIGEQNMGMPQNRERASVAVDVLIEWREWIWEHVT